MSSGRDFGPSNTEIILRLGICEGGTKALHGEVVVAWFRAGSDRKGRATVAYSFHLIVVRYGWFSGLAQAAAFRDKALFFVDRSAKKPPASPLPSVQTARL